MKKHYIFKAMAALAIPAMVLSSCSDSDDPNPDPNPEESTQDGGKFVLATQVTVQGVATNALVPAESVDSGKVSPLNNPYALKNDGATQWIFYKNFCYALTYNQGNAGLTRSYILDADSKLQERDETYAISRFSSYGMYDDYIITMATGNGTTGADAEGHLPMTLNVTYLDVYNEQKSENDTKSGKYSMENFLGNGEYVTLSGAEQSGSKLYCGVIPMGLSQYGYSDKSGPNGTWVLPGNEHLVNTADGGSGGGSYQAGTISATQYPDECWVAIYPNKDFLNPKIANTNKISYPAGRFRSQYYQTIWAAENGDIYVFSPSYARTQTKDGQKGSLKAGVCRIPAGKDDFDNYYVDLEAQLGKSFMRCWAAGGNYFILQTYDEAYGEGFSGNAHGLAIFDADSQSVKPVTGLPASIQTIGKNVYVKDGYVYATVTKTDSYPIVYRINPKTCVAEAGLTIEANDVTGFGYLTPQK